MTWIESKLSNDTVSAGETICGLSAHKIMLQYSVHQYLVVSSLFTTYCTVPGTFTSTGTCTSTGTVPCTSSTRYNVQYHKRFCELIGTRDTPFFQG